MIKPLVLAVADDERVLTTLAALLRRRYDADYRVLAERSATLALRVLERLRAAGEPVAVVIVDQAMREMSGLDLLARVRAVHPSAQRALLIEQWDQSGNEVLAQGLAFGVVDNWLPRPWDPPEEYLYPVVGELLAAWTRTTGGQPRHEAVRVVAAPSTPRAHELRDLLERNSIPYGFYAADSRAGRRLLADAGQQATRLPVAVMFDGRVLVDPSNRDVAAALGIRTRPEGGEYDVAIVGAGPAGLAAAVYGASEGLRTVILEPQAVGGQAGTSSLIRNYLGFPRGISGAKLAMEASTQAILFGAAFVYNEATALHARGDERIIELVDGGHVACRAVVIATGASWRRLGVPDLEALVGAGVFYGAATSEAPTTRGGQVFVVGAGNSAAQAAIHLAKFAAMVTLVVRGDSLAKSMSDYLIRQIEQTERIVVRLRTRVIDGGGDGQLRRLRLQQRDQDAVEEVAADALFVLIGAVPHSDWLADGVQRDERGYILTGRDLQLAAGMPRWSVPREPLTHETSLPGVFAVGDVRHGSTKRVASAAGDGSVTVQYIHQYLAWH